MNTYKEIWVSKESKTLVVNLNPKRKKQKQKIWRTQELNESQWIAITIGITIAITIVVTQLKRWVVYI